ncbi:hypothetical protein PVAND_002018 [Polypedilum vanderplanki]|uniref:Signal peptidase complex subunit 3 n=1 Tax=Polypedilum vanderplanki TaxID=319348 RepID=A0A9J6BPQ4_POLVA|nr:hypothetical protein PVAND_002018 [Polypedilum vanderplanki]
MHNYFDRINNVTSFFVTITFLIILTLMSSTIVFPKDLDEEPILYSNTNMTKKIATFTVVYFDLEADFEALFNWNVKQLFIYVFAEFQKSNGVHVNMMIWDRILRRGSTDNWVNLKNVPAKYYLNDLKYLCSSNLTLSVHWISIPTAGVFYPYNHKESRITFPLPNDKTCSA